ncbi:hypothetical protein T4D_13718 [Trichinella pseudospiralis]|uniref:Uncharacterized protein n=1 Tax=Trichinella pseudospiralis TaxID=6337 RepID=A0A0V1FUH6_TRIPS|nr:hypothetical protein T4D_13718 [Trichinella pseudospiralis]
MNATTFEMDNLNVAVFHVLLSLKLTLSSGAYWHVVGEGSSKTSSSSIVEQSTGSKVPSIFQILTIFFGGPLVGRPFTFYYTLLVVVVVVVIGLLPNLKSTSATSKHTAK